MCGLAPSLGLLLLFRVIQGAGGGGLQPIAQAIMADSFEPSKRALAFSLYGFVAVLAPSIGPTLGGWITFNYNWNWIFFINLPVGIIALFLTQQVVEDPPWIKADLGNFKRVDYWGFGLLALSMGTLEVSMDKGEEWDWFGSTKIRWFFGTFILGFILLIWREWTAKNPLIQVKLFKFKNFALCAILMLAVGGILNASTVLQPQLLQSYFGYTPTLAGLTLSGGGVVLLGLLPLAGKLLGRFPARSLIAFGYICFAVGFLWSGNNLNLGLDFWHLTVMRVIQVIGIPFVFISITTAAYFNVPKELNNQVSGLINFMRNLGGSVLISLTNAFITESQQFHRTAMLKHISSSSMNYQQTLHQYQSAVSGSVGPANAASGAQQQIYSALGNQAGILSYVDVYWLLGYAAIVMVIMSFILDRNNPRDSTGGSAAAH